MSLALGAYGAGSMLVALLLPRVLGRAGDRALMLPAAVVMTVVLGILGAGLAAGPGKGSWAWPALLVAWLLIGAATSVILTPGGRLVRRSAATPDLPAAFAAQFSLAHACWLVTYPLAGWLAARAGPAVAAGALAVVALAGTVVAVRLWPRTDPAELPHAHPELPRDHPHLAGAGQSHTHDFHIDVLHPHWPARADADAGHRSAA
ncbi:MFS transporter [Streptomyces sp. NPDC003863]